MVTFKPLSEVERKELSAALKGNAEAGKDSPLYMDPKDTSFVPRNRIAGLLNRATPLTPADPVEDEEVIAAIGSVPCHY